MKRKGLHIRCKHTHPEVKEAIILFAKWLRKKQIFPIRVPVYVSAREKVLTRKGQECFALFFEPFGGTEEPFIKIATGDYKQEKAKRGKYSAIAAILCSLAHEVIHYLNWCKQRQSSEKRVSENAKSMTLRYLHAIKNPRVVKAKAMKTTKR